MFKKKAQYLFLFLYFNLFFFAMIPAYSHNTGSPVNTNQVGIDEKPGNYVPMDLPFTTETGVPILFRDAVKGPTVLSIVYYKCPNACDYQLTGIASILSTYADNAADKPNLVTVTVDENETPADAMKAKTIAYESIQKPYPSDKWHFLTGGKESIRKLTDAVGFRYTRNGDDFDHPMALIILSPEGKITRYILGTDYLPVDLTMSLLEASSGTVRPAIARVLRFCFSYNPKSHGYVFNILKVSATVIITLLLIFILYLMLSGRRRVKGGN